MSRPRRRPSRVSESLQRVLRRIDPDQRMEVYRVWAFWDEEVGEVVAARARPRSFRDGVLSVEVSAHAWMQELQFLKETLRAKLNARLGRELIRDVYFVAGKVGTRRAGPGTGASASEEQPEGPPPSVPELRDPRLRELFERLARAHSRHRPTKD